MLNTWTIRSSISVAAKLLHAFTKTLPYLKKALSVVSLTHSDSQGSRTPTYFKHISIEATTPKANPAASITLAVGFTYRRVSLKLAEKLDLNN
jgi:hypothetical protein